MGYNYSSLAETFEFSWSLFAEEHNTLPQSIRRNINIWNPIAMATRFLMHSYKHWFMSSLCNFCRWGANIAPDKMPWATRSKEKRLLLQVTLNNVVLIFKLPLGDNKHLNFEGNGGWKGTDCFFFLLNMPHLTTVTQNVLSDGGLCCKIKRHWMHSHLAILDISLIRESGQTIIVKKTQLMTACTSNFIEHNNTISENQYWIRIKIKTSLLLKFD